MGKYKHKSLQQQNQLQQTQVPEDQGSSRFFVCHRFSNQFSFKCLAVLIISLCLFVSCLFWVLPFRSKSGFEAQDEIKRSASVQAYFRLEKPVWQLVPHKDRLQNDIFDEIGVQCTKVKILSMHQSVASNSTDVVFGVLSEITNTAIDPASLSVLRLALIELFLGKANLRLTTSIFGQASKFEILKFPGGVTVIPSNRNYIVEIPQILFNFTLLNSSISDIENHSITLIDQLRCGLRLRSYEIVYMQVTNTYGSTNFPPVTVQASVLSDLGKLPPERLNQLARSITESTVKNLCLNHSVFGKINSVVLSAFLNDTLHPPHQTPSPSPTPAPAPAPSTYLAHSPSYSPRPLHNRRPCAPGPKVKRPHQPIHNSHESHQAPVPLRSSRTDLAPKLAPMAPLERLPPDISPLPQVSYGFIPDPDRESEKIQMSSSPALSSSARSLSSSLFFGFNDWIRPTSLSGLMIFHLLCLYH